MDNLVERLNQRLNQEPMGRDVVGSTFRAYPPATEKALLSTETRLSFSLPQTLRQIYRNVANGGFGPGYGVMGAEGGFTDDLGQTVVDLYESYREPDPDDPTWQWPQHFLPICHCGCIIYSVVDCSRIPSPVYFVDVSNKEPVEAMESILLWHKPSFEVWLSDWLAGKDLWTEVWGSDDTDGES